MGHAMGHCRMTGRAARRRNPDRTANQRKLGSVSIKNPRRREIQIGALYKRLKRKSVARLVAKEAAGKLLGGSGAAAAGERTWGGR